MTHQLNIVAPADARTKLRETEIKKILGICLKPKKDVKHEVGGDTIDSLFIWNLLHRSGNEIGGIGNKRKNQDHREHSSIDNTY